ncbi:MAG: porin, partial [Candidatus Puniceispirillaceae bacterium]
MRKILLASTALVALTSVSAMAADVSISGSSEIVLDMGDSATADQSSFATENDIAISFTNTTDSGITTSMSYGMDDADNTADDLVVSISGDFGTISYTGVGARDDHALTAVDNEASGTAEENTGTLPSGTYTGSLPSLG